MIRYCILCVHLGFIVPVYRNCRGMVAREVWNLGVSICAAQFLSAAGGGQIKLDLQIWVDLPDVARYD